MLCEAIGSRMFEEHTVVCTIILFLTNKSPDAHIQFFFSLPEELTSSTSVNLLGKFISFLPGCYAWYICFFTSVKITRCCVFSSLAFEDGNEGN